MCKWGLLPQKYDVCKGYHQPSAILFPPPPAGLHAHLLGTISLTCILSTNTVPQLSVHSILDAWSCKTSFHTQTHKKPPPARRGYTQGYRVRSPPSFNLTLNKHKKKGGGGRKAPINKRPFCWSVSDSTMGAKLVSASKVYQVMSRTPWHIHRK